MFTVDKYCDDNFNIALAIACNLLIIAREEFLCYNKIILYQASLYIFCIITCKTFREIRTTFVRKFGCQKDPSRTRDIRIF